MTDTSHRMRSMAALFAGVGLSSTGIIVMAAVVPLVAKSLLDDGAELLGSEWSGLPSALAIAGTAFGSSWLTSIMSRHGRRRGLLAGYLAGTIAAGMASAAAGFAVFFLFLLSVFAFGIGYSANYLSRYAAADLYDSDQKARAIGIVVWAGTIGSVIGPNLLQPAQNLGEALGMPALTAPVLLASTAMGLAGLIVLVGFPPTAAPETAVATSPHRPISYLGHAKSQVALAALVVGQAVMILIMTMTPIHVRDGGGDLRSVGIVMAAHTFGMFALSPFSSYLSDRLGRRPVIVLAGALLVSSALVSSGADDRISLLALGLFLLGWGWNFGFVAGSALLTESVPDEHRLQVQGLVDTFVWVGASAGAAVSGLLLHSVGYEGLCRVGLVLALVPMTLVAVRRW